MLITDRILIRGSNSPVPDGTSVDIRNEITNALIATVTTTDGFFTWQADGSPGPVIYTCAYDGATKVHSSKSVGPAGLVQLGELQDTLTFFAGGIVRGVANELAVTPAVSGFTVTVATGSATSKGMVHRQYSPLSLTFVPQSPDSLTINDYSIYIEFHGATSATPAKTRIFASNVKHGSEASPPTGAWWVELARVTIDPVATSLTTGNIVMKITYSDYHTHSAVDVTDFASSAVATLGIPLNAYTTGAASNWRNQFAYTLTTGTTITIGSGGYIYTTGDNAILIDVPTDTSFTIPVSGNPAYIRYDIIALTIDPLTGFGVQTGTLTRVAGPAGASPTLPTLTANQFGISLIQVNNTAIVTNVPLAPVSGVTPPNNSVTTSKLTFAAVTTINLADANVTTSKIADSAITTPKLADANVTLAKLATASVDSSKIVDGSIVTADIADGNVTGAKIAFGTINGTNINAGAVGTTQLADGNVTGAKIASGTINGANVNAGAIGTTQLADGNVTIAKLAANSVDTTKIVDGTIVAGDLASNAITTVKITDANVTGPKIAANAIDYTKFSANLAANLYAAKADVVMDGATITATTYTAASTDVATMNVTVPAGTHKVVLDVWFTGKATTGTPSGRVSATIDGTDNDGPIRHFLTTSEDEYHWHQVKTITGALTAVCKLRLSSLSGSVDGKAWAMRADVFEVPTVPVG